MMNLTVGDLIVIAFNAGTQVARIYATRPDQVMIRSYRKSTGIWTKRMRWIKREYVLCFFDGDRAALVDRLPGEHPMDWKRRRKRFPRLKYSAPKEKVE